mmetsp:Transcript_39604/g.112304  ORF Transcript_39604/g.112304 Transcript_39604/m.112304 type:complete len:238 (-) Transcript_39604:524-1237(-)
MVVDLAELIDLGLSEALEAPVNSEECLELVKVQFSIAAFVGAGQRFPQHRMNGDEAEVRQHALQLAHRDLAALVLVILLEHLPELLLLPRHKALHKADEVVEVEIVEVRHLLDQRIHDFLLHQHVAQVSDERDHVAPVQVAGVRNLEALEGRLHPLELHGREIVAVLLLRFQESLGLSELVGPRVHAHDAPHGRNARRAAAARKALRVHFLVSLILVLRLERSRIKAHGRKVVIGVC